jgi:hypothetical protein
MEFTEAQVAVATQILEEGGRSVRVARALGISRHYATILINAVEQKKTPSRRAVEALLRDNSTVYEVALDQEIGIRGAKTSVLKAQGAYNPVQEELRDLTALGCPWKELQRKFSFKSYEEAEEHLKEAWGEGTLVSKTRTEDGEYFITPVRSTVMTDASMLVLPSSDKKFRYKVSPSYLWIKFDDNIKGDELRIGNFSDVHFGSRSHRGQDFQKVMSYVLSDPAFFFFDGGDTTETNYRDSAGDPMEQYLTNNEQIEEAVRQYGPGADKMLWKVWGNHCGGRTEKACQLDASRLIAQFLHVPYYRNRVIVDIEWRGQLWTIFSTHKWGNAVDQAAVVKAIRSVQSDYCGTLFHYFTSGHNHQSFIQRINFMRRSVGRGIITDSAYVVNSGSFVRQSGTYADEMSPKPQDFMFLRLRDDCPPSGIAPGSIRIDHL